MNATNETPQIAAFKKAHEAHLTGINLLEAGKYEEAAESIIKSIKNFYHNELSHVHLALALHKAGQVDLALHHIENAAPNFPQSLYLPLIKHELLYFDSDNRRWAKHIREDLALALNLDLRLSRIEGKNILITHDFLHGDGDFIQYARLLKYLSYYAASVTIETDKFNGLRFLHGVVMPSHVLDRCRFDVQIPIWQLIFWFGSEAFRDKPSNGYLSVNSKYQKKWIALLKPKAKPRIGICWHGSLQHPDKDRFFNSSNLCDLLTLDDYEFFSLQKDPDPSYTDDAMRHKYTDLTHHINDYGDTAALIENLDAVVSVDTSIAHLAGAMGRPIAVIRPPYKRIPWLSEDRAWYKSAAVFSKVGQSWRDVVNKVISAIPNVLSR